MKNEELEKLALEKRKELKLKGTIDGFMAGFREAEQRMFDSVEVELIALEMVTWAIENVGNISANSGEKFDQVMAKYQKASQPEITQ
jgi:hypothetical protein